MTAAEDQQRLELLTDNRDGHAVACIREYLADDIPMPSLSMFKAADRKLEDFQTALYVAAKARRAGAA